MVTPSIRAKDYALGVQPWRSEGDHYVLGHCGGGLGFKTEMMWFPEYEFGAVFLSNSERTDWMLGKIFFDLINENLIQKGETVDRPSSEYLASPPPPDPNTFTPFKPAWKKYIGTYKYVMSGWKFSIPARIGMATLVGRNTGGGATGYVAPPVVGLPASGMAFRVETDLVINQDGSYNEIGGTPPDIQLEPADPPKSITREELLKDEWVKKIIHEMSEN